jgi:hypothetical protein
VPAEEPEEGHAPELRHEYDRPFEELIAGLREEGLGDEAIAAELRARADRLERAK